MYKRSSNKAFTEQLEARGYFGRVGIYVQQVGRASRTPVTMTIDESGDFTMLDTKGSEIFLTMGEVTTRRASHVYPVNNVKRAAFKTLRAIFGDKGRVSDWTRTWGGYWIVDTTPTAGIVLDATYASHADAVTGEIKFLNEYFLRGTK